LIEIVVFGETSGPELKVVQYTNTLSTLLVGYFWNLMRDSLCNFSNSFVQVCAFAISNTKNTGYTKMILCIFVH